MRQRSARRNAGRLQAADKVRGAGGSSPCRGLGQTPGRSIVAVGAGRARRSFRSPPPGRFGPFGPKCPQGHTLPFGAPKPYAAAYFVSVASVRRTQETRFFPKPGVFQRPEAPGAMPGASACRFGLSPTGPTFPSAPLARLETRKTEPAAHVGAARRRRAACPAQARDAFVQPKIRKRHRRFGLHSRPCEPLKWVFGQAEGGMRMTRTPPRSSSVWHLRITGPRPRSRRRSGRCWRQRTRRCPRRDTGG